MIISIVTPTLNAARYLPECIDSVRRNCGPGIEAEHVIVDGGSTDGTLEIAHRFGVRVLTGKDSGIFDAVNKGSLQSSGELIGFLGGDDLLLDGALARVAQVYRDTGRRWIVGGIRWVDEDGRSLGNLIAPPNWMTPGMHASIGWNPIMQMSTFLTRDFFVELDGFNIDYRVSGDYEMFCRALRVAPYARVGASLACFRRTGQNFSATNKTRADAEYRKIVELYGPKRDVERQLWRASMRTWLNLGDLRWLVGKLTTPARARFAARDMSPN